MLTTSRSPTMPPESLIFFASGLSSRSLTTIGGQVSPRARMMNWVLVPLPAPGAPPRRMISFGKRNCSCPSSSSSASQTALKIRRASLISRSSCRSGVAGLPFIWSVILGQFGQASNEESELDLQGAHPVMVDHREQPQQQGAGSSRRRITAPCPITRRGVAKSVPGGARVRCGALPSRRRPFCGSRSIAHR